MFESQPAQPKTAIPDYVARIQAVIATMLRDLHAHGPAALDSVRAGLQTIEGHANNIHLVATGQTPIEPVVSAPVATPEMEVERPKGMLETLFGSPTAPDGTPKPLEPAPPAAPLFPTPPATP